MKLDKPIYVNSDFDPNDAYSLAKSLNGEAAIVNFNIPYMNRMADLAFARMFVELVVTHSHIRDADRILKIKQDEFKIFYHYFHYEELITMINNILNILKQLPFRYEFLVISNWTKNPNGLEAVVVSTPI